MAKKVRGRRIAYCNNSISKKKIFFVRGKDANIYLGAMLTIIACMYGIIDSSLQVIDNKICKIFCSDKSSLPTIFSCIRDNIDVASLAIFCTKFSLNIIGFFVIFILWRIAVKRDGE